MSRTGRRTRLFRTVAVERMRAINATMRAMVTVWTHPDLFPTDNDPDALLTLAARLDDVSALAGLLAEDARERAKKLAAS